MSRRLPSRSWAAADQFHYVGAAVADDMGKVAEAQGENSPMLFFGKANIKNPGLAFVADVFLQDQCLVRWIGGDIPPQGPFVVNEAHTEPAPTDVGLDHEREIHALHAKLLQRRSNFTTYPAVGGFNNDVRCKPFPFFTLHEIQALTFRFAEESSGFDQWVRYGRQRQASVTKAESEPLDYDRNVEQQRRDALGQRSMCRKLWKNRHSPMCLPGGRGRNVFRARPRPAHETGSG